MDTLLTVLIFIGAILALIAVRWIIWRVNVAKFHRDFTEWERQRIVRGDLPKDYGKTPIDELRGAK